MDKYAAQVNHQQEERAQDDGQTRSPRLELDQIDPFLVHFDNDEHDDDDTLHESTHILTSISLPLEHTHSAHSTLAIEGTRKTMSMNGTHSTHLTDTLSAHENGDVVSSAVAASTGETTLLPTLNVPKQNGVATTTTAPGDEDRTRDFGELLDAINLGNSSSINGATSNPASAAALAPSNNHGGKHDEARWKGTNETDSRHRQAQQRMSKRKRTDSDIGDGTPKLRRMIHDRFSNMSTAQRTMTTITTFHASAAQKSYGQEKRFLCPPPLVRISGGGPLFSTDVLKSQQMKMSVLSDMGIVLQEHSAPFDPEYGIVCFKQLHINSKGKEKQFQLVLSISDQFHATSGDGAMVQGGSRGRNIKAQGAPTDASTSTNPASTRAPWATFYSSPVHIISKPSKKSTRGATPNILNLNSVALFNRINSQTVRTKYLSYRREGNAASSGGGPSNILHMNGGAENGLTTSSSHWSPFIISLVPPNSHNAPVRFGARIRLSSPDNSYVSHEYIIRKVENKRSLETDFGTQVSQMQKIALLRADVAPNAEGRVCYLSALVERPGPEPITVIPGSTHSTSWRWAEVKTEVAEDGTTSEVHLLDDYATWMIAGISQFQYTFFDATGSNTVPPRVPLTPAPKLNYPPRWIHPIQQGGEHSLEMSITHFYSSTLPGQPPAVSSAAPPSTVNPAATNSPGKQPLQIWIGDLGPLKTNSYEGLLTNHDGLTQSGFVFPVLPPFGLHHDPAQGQAGMIAPTTLHPSLPGMGAHGSLDVPLPLAMPMTMPMGQVAPSLASPVVNIHNSMTGEMLRTPVLTAFPPGEFHYVAGGAPGSAPLGGNVSMQAQTHGVGTLRDPAPSTFVAAFLPEMNDLIRTLLDSVRTPVQRPDFLNATGTSSGRTSGDMDVELDRPSRIHGDLDEREEDDTMMDGGLAETDEELWARNPALPILLIRPTDGMGFHSGYVVKCVPAQGHGLDNVSGWSIKIEKADLGAL